MDRAIPRVPGTERSSLASLGAGVLEALAARWRRSSVILDGFGGGCSIDDAAAFTPVDQIHGIGDHGGQVGVHPATEVRHCTVLEIRLGRIAPIGASRDLGTSPAHDYAHSSRLDFSCRNRSARLDHHAILAGYDCDLVPRSRSVSAVDVDGIAIAKAETLKPAVEPFGFAGREGSAWGRCVEHIIRSGDHRNVDRGYALFRNVGRVA